MGDRPPVGKDATYQSGKIIIIQLTNNQGTEEMRVLAQSWQKAPERLKYIPVDALPTLCMLESCLNETC